MILACDVHTPHAGLRGRQPDALGPGLLAGGAVPAGGRPRRPLRAERLARDGRAVAEGDRRRGRQGGRAARAGAGRPVGAGPDRRHCRCGACAALGRGGRPDRRAAGGEPRRPRRDPASWPGPGGWPRTPTGPSSRRPTWRSPCGGTWATPGPASSSSSSAGSARRSARWPNAGGPRRPWTTGATTSCSTCSPPRASSTPRASRTRRTSTRIMATARRPTCRRWPRASIPAARRPTRASCSRPCAAGSTEVGQQADRDGADEAASELTTVYMTDFEPIERYLLGRSPQSVRPLEIQFNALRGEISAGLKGEELAEPARSALRRRSRPWSPGSRPGRRGRSAPRSSSR